MARIKGDDDMSSSVRSSGSKLLYGEGDLFDQGLLIGGWSWWSEGEKLSVDSYQAVLRGTTGLLRRGLVAVLHKATFCLCKVAFSSSKATLVAKKEANYC